MEIWSHFHLKVGICVKAQKGHEVSYTKALKVVVMGHLNFSDLKFFSAYFLLSHDMRNVSMWNMYPSKQSNIVTEKSGPGRQGVSQQ